MQNSQWDEKKKEFKLEKNPDFLTAVEAFVTAKGLSKKDPIILLCRSGNRTSTAATLLQKAGFQEVYSVVDGFEGDKAKDGDVKGKRVVNGWKNAGLPWSYDMDASKMYLR